MEPLFLELQKRIESGDHEAVLEQADVILAKKADDLDALTVKLTALLNLGEYADTVAVCSALPADLRAKVHFPHAYALYALHRYAEARDVLLPHRQAPSFSRSASILLSQCFFRLRDAAASASLYTSIPRGNAPQDIPLAANTVAALLAADDIAGARAFVTRSDYPMDDFDCCFNAACAFHADGDNVSAARCIEKCREIARAEGTDEDSLAPLDAINAVVLMHNGDRVASASAAIAAVKKAAKDSDTALVACATLGAATKGNISAAPPVVADAFNKHIIDGNMPSAAVKRLSDAQKKEIARIRALLALQNKELFKANFKDILALYKSAGGSKEDVIILDALYRKTEKSTEDAVTLLNDFASRNKAESSVTRAVLTAAQLLIENKHMAAAAKTCDKFLPADLLAQNGVAISVAAMRQGAGDMDGAMKIIEELALENAKKGNYIICKRLGDILNARGKNEVVAKMYETLKSLKDSAEFTVKISAAQAENLARTNLKRAQELAKELPALKKPVNPGTLENLPPFKSTFPVGQAVVDAANAAAAATMAPKGKTPQKGKGKDAVAAAEKKKRKKRKIRLPKDFDPEKQPDPDRWLPKELRRSYRGKKKPQQSGKTAREREREELSRGVQGMQDDALAAELATRHERSAAEAAKAAMVAKFGTEAPRKKGNRRK